MAKPITTESFRRKEKNMYFRRVESEQGNIRVTEVCDIFLSISPPPPPSTARLLASKYAGKRSAFQRTHGGAIPVR